MTARRSLALVISMAVAVMTAGFTEAYPQHWWERVPDADQQWWEIVPHEAAPGELVLSKRNELGIFSNFAQTPFYFHGKRYESVEGFWYMLAYPEGPDDPRSRPDVEWPHTREEVSRMVGFEAKGAGAVAEGNMAVLGINWVTYEGRRLKYWSHERGPHYELIRQVLEEKVRQNPRIQELLLSTGDLRLIPDNYDSLRDLPAWRYFDVHREIRDSLRSEGEAASLHRYPAHWWRPVLDAEAGESEVLPQAAGPGEVILSRRNELGILSSSASTPFELGGKRYESLEALLRSLEGDAHGAGPDPDLALAARRAMLDQNPDAARILLSTGDLMLRADRLHPPDTPPAWRCCDHWMALRDELQAAHPRTLKVVRTDGALVDF